VRIRRSRKQGIARLEIPVSTAQAKHRIHRLPAEAVKPGRIPTCRLFRAGDGDFQPLENELPCMEPFQAFPSFDQRWTRQLSRRVDRAGGHHGNRCCSKLDRVEMTRELTWQSW
jgi:hypothetical protein